MAGNADYMTPSAYKRGGVNLLDIRLCRWMVVAALFLALGMSPPCVVAASQGRGLQPSVYERWSRIDADSLLNHAEHYLERPNMQDSALLCYTIVANLYYHDSRDERVIRQVVRAMTNLGMMYTHFYYDYSKAQAYLLQAHELAENYGIKDALPYISLNQAKLNQVNWSILQVDDFDRKAVETFKQPFREALAAGEWSILGAVFTGLAMNALEGGLLDSIREEMAVIDTIRVVDNPDMRRAKCFSRAIKAYQEEKYDSALALLREMETHSGKKYLSKVTSRLYAKMIRYSLLFHLHRYDEGLALLEEVEKEAREEKLHDYLLEVYDKRFYYYKNVAHDKALADKNHLLLLQMKDQILTGDQLTNMEKTRFLFELHKSERKMQEMAYEQRIGRRVTWLTAALLLVVLVTLAILCVHYLKMRRKNRQLYARVQELIASEQKNRQLAMLYEQSVKGAEEAEKGKYAKSPMQEEDKSDLLHRIFIVMETSEEVFGEGFTLDRLSELVGDKRKNVSQVINEKYHTNFNGILSDYRIREACRRISDTEHYGNLTIEGIAQSVGFKSRTNFASVFKRYTGLTPSAYQRMTREEKE